MHSEDSLPNRYIRQTESVWGQQKWERERERKCILGMMPVEIIERSVIGHKMSFDKWCLPLAILFIFFYNSFSPRRRSSP